MGHETGKYTDMNTVMVYGYRKTFINITFINVHSNVRKLRGNIYIYSNIHRQHI